MAELHETLPPLGWLKAFETAARLLSFTAAAKELGLTQAAVSQQIRLLEAYLKVKLFRRLRRGVELTGEGASYLPHVQSGFKIIARSTRELFGRQLSGNLTISCPISFACLWLAPRLKAFNAVHPDITVEISTIHVPEDYAAQDADLDIRLGPGNFAHREAIRLTRERLVPVASPKLIAKLKTRSAWLSLPRLSLSGGREMWSQWFDLAGLAPEKGPSHRFDSFIAALAAAVSGAGVLLGSRPLVDDALAIDSLVRLSSLELASASGHFVTYAGAGRLSPAAEDFLAWLAATANAAPEMRDQ